MNMIECKNEVKGDAPAKGGYIARDTTEKEVVYDHVPCCIRPDICNGQYHQT